MKAVYINEAGGPEVMIYGDRPNPEPEPGEVLIRVRSSAINFADLGVRSRGATGGFPRILGLDMAGEVVQAGSDSLGLQPGDRVLVDNRVKCGTCENCLQSIDQYCSNQKRLGADIDGGHAEYCVVPAINVYRFSDDMSFEEAAALPIAGHTAWHCVMTRGQLQPWEDILIQAAGSGVGSTGIQIAKHIGARVITTAGSDWKLERAKGLGADEVINYNDTPNFSERIMELTNGRGVDMVFDVVGAAVWEQNLRSLKPGGRLVITGTTSGNRTDMDLSILQGRPLTLMGSGGRPRRTFGEMMKVVNAGGLRGVVGRTFPLEGAAEAHRTMASRDFFGKLVLSH